MTLNYIIGVSIALLVINLSSCNSSNTKPKTAEEKCVEKKGEWKMLTRGVIGCNITYNDGKKSCTDGTQCKSNVCLWDKRTTELSKHCAASTIEVIHAGCTGGKIVKGQPVALGCP